MTICAQCERYISGDWLSYDGFCIQCDRQFDHPRHPLDRAKLLYDKLCADEPASIARTEEGLAEMRQAAEDYGKIFAQRIANGEGG